MATGGHGRPRVTTHAAIEDAAFELFEARGFHLTTMEDIAEAVGIGRRTLFRYYPSKNDILWGQFEDSLRSFHDVLASTPQGEPLAPALRDAVVAFNSFDEHAIPQHRRRMALLLGTPALMAHSELRYAAWRRTVSEFVSHRTGDPPGSLAPLVAGRVALALALAAYEDWLQHAGSDLQDVIRASFEAGTCLLAKPSG
jgi:mycofactocin system transcriptional regulator